MILSFVFGLFFLCIPFFLSRYNSRSSEILFWQTDLIRFNKSSLLLVILIASLTAIYFTNFQTIQLLSLPLLVVLIRKVNINAIHFKINLLELFVVYSFSFLLIFIALGQPGSATDINIHYDIHFYAKLSQKIMEGNVEHIGAQLSSYIENKGITLYHYTDLWFTGIFSFILQQPTILVICFFTYPILLTTGFFTLKEFIQELGYENSTLKTFCIILIVTFGFSFPTNLIQSTFFEVSYSHLVFIPGFDIYSTKTLILLPILTMAFSCLFRKDYLTFTGLILLSIITYSTTLLFFSALLFTVLFHKLFFEIKNKSWNNTENYKLFFVLLIYFISLTLVILNWVDFTVLPKNASILSIKSILILYFEYNFSTLFVYVIPIIFIPFIEPRENKWIVLKIVLFFFVSSSITSIYLIKYTDEPNSIQALLNAAPFIFLILSLLIYTFLKKRFRTILLFCFLLCALYNVGTHTLYNGKFNNDEKTIQALLENENSPKKWAVIDSFLTENKFYKSKQLGIFLFYNKNLDYPADLSNFFVLSKEQQFALSPTNKGPLEQEYLNSKNETKDFVLRNFIIKNDISFILSRNKSANGILKNYSVDQGLFSLKYSSGGLELWKVNKVN
jgi:hypothetical protein